MRKQTGRGINTCTNYMCGENADEAADAFLKSSRYEQYFPSRNELTMYVQGRCKEMNRNIHMGYLVAKNRGKKLIYPKL